MSPHRLSSDVAQGELALLHPRLDVDEPMITSRENRTEPDRRHATQTQALPVAMGGKMGVKPRRQSHPFHLRQPHSDIVDAYGDNVWFLVHPQSVTQSRI